MAVNPLYPLDTISSIAYKQSSSFTTELITFECTWTIKNISRLCVSTEQFVGQPMICSPIFIAPPDKITTVDKQPVAFQLIFYPKGCGNENRDFVGVYLGLRNHFGLDIMCVFSVVKANGERLHLCSVIQRFGPNSYGSNNHLRRDVLCNPAKGFVTKDSLTLHCEVNIFMGEPAKSDLVVDQLQSKYCPPEQLTKSYGDLLESGSYADVTFVLVGDGGQELRAHKNILATRSRVFADMFESRMAESVTNRVEIVESREVFKQALHFIYTGKVDTELDAIAKDLLICADKYQLDPLKLICEEYLYSNITTETNLSDLLELATRHNAPKLKAKVIDSIQKKFQALIQDANKAQMDRFLFNLVNEMN